MGKHLQHCASKGIRHPLPILPNSCLLTQLGFAEATEQAIGEVSRFPLQGIDTQCTRTWHLITSFSPTPTPPGPAQTAVANEFQSTPPPPPPPPSPPPPPPALPALHVEKGTQSKPLEPDSSDDEEPDKTKRQCGLSAFNKDKYLSLVSDHYPDYLNDSADKLLLRRVMVRFDVGEGRYQWRQGRVVRLALRVSVLNGDAKVCCQNNKLGAWIIFTQPDVVRCPLLLSPSL